MRSVRGALVALCCGCAFAGGLGCRREPPPAPDVEPTSCEAVLGQLRRSLTVELAGLPGATVPLAKALAIGARSCAEDDWPMPLRRCVLEVPLVDAVPALLRCAELAPELRARLEREIREALR